MRDFPVFTTENGVGSLILKDVPYWGNAYIKIQDVTDGTKFLSECIDFCKAVGAGHIYGLEHPVTHGYPLYSTVIKMTAPCDSFREDECCLFPVTYDTIEKWKRIYNKKMKGIPNATYMDLEQCAQMERKGEAYFVHRNGELLGIGAVGQGTIKVVASLKQGMGKHIVSALIQITGSDTVSLEVSSANTKAVKLYESLGFVKIQELSRWHKIL